MSYVVRVKVGKKTLYGKRKFKTEAGAKKSINSPSGKSYIKKYKLKNVVPVKSRETKKMKIF